MSTMPLDLTVDRARRVVMMHGSGVLTDADLASARTQCESIPEAELSFARICDLSELTDVSVTAEALGAWTSSAISNPPVRHAIVCSAAPVLKQVLDFVTLSRRAFRDITVFPTYDKAMDWLGHDQ
jgi:hypothetical protein